MSTDTAAQAPARTYVIDRTDLIKAYRKCDQDHRLSHHGCQLIGLLGGKMQLRFEGHSVKLVVPADTSIQHLGAVTGLALLDYSKTRNVDSLVAALPGLQQHIKSALGLAA